MPGDHTMTTQIESCAFKLGFRAGRAGVDTGACPYAPGRDADVWMHWHAVGVRFELILNDHIVPIQFLPEARPRKTPRPLRELASPHGFEPRLPESKSGVLPLDEGEVHVGSPLADDAGEQRESLARSA
jgi:hypothetical protein